VACGLLAAVLAGACGGGGGGGGASKSAYVSNVNRLCREAASERRTLVPPANATPQQLVDALKEAVAVDKQLRERMTALTPPSGDAATIRRLLELMNQSDDVALQLADAIQHSDAPTFKVLSPKFAQLGAQTKQIAGSYGLTACTEKV